MAKFTVDHESSKTPQDAYTRIKEFLSNDQDLRRFDSKLQCYFNDDEMAANLKGGQFKADMTVAAISTGSKVSITVDLPLMLTPFKGKVQETLQKKLAKYLG